MPHTFYSVENTFPPESVGLNPTSYDPFCEESLLCTYIDGKFYQYDEIVMLHVLIDVKHLAPRGIEPVTFALLARRSNQLS